MIDDHETAGIAIGALRRAVSWFADDLVNVERVFSDNGSDYRLHACWHARNECFGRTIADSRA